MVFRWRADDDPFIVVFVSSIPLSTKKSVIKFGPPLTKLSGSVHDKGCVRSYANSTIGLPMPFGVQPFVTLAYHWYHWLSTSFTICSKFCRRSRAWLKRFTREKYVIKMEDLKNLAADTSGITTILPIQMTINNKITNV